jgi:hypothetical protein
MVTFIGILEFSADRLQEQADSQMTDMENGEEPGLAQAIPNEDKLPSLHVLSHRRNYVLHSIEQLPLPKVSTSTISEHSQKIKEASEKVVSVLKMILDNDK